MLAPLMASSPLMVSSPLMAWSPLHSTGKGMGRGAFAVTAVTSTHSGEQTAATGTRGRVGAKRAVCIPHATLLLLLLLILIVIVTWACCTHDCLVVLLLIVLLLHLLLTVLAVVLVVVWMAAAAPIAISIPRIFIFFVVVGRLVSLSRVRPPCRSTR